MDSILYRFPSKFSICFCNCFKAFKEHLLLIATFKFSPLVIQNFIINFDLYFLPEIFANIHLWTCNLSQIEDFNQLRDYYDLPLIKVLISFLNCSN